MTRATRTARAEGMSKWIHCGADFVEADIIRYTEIVWKPRKRRTDKAQKIGTREIVGRVAACNTEWADVVIQRCDTTVEPGWAVEELKADELIHRRRNTIAQGQAERLLWSDESARALVASRFFGDASAAPKHADAPRDRVPAARANRGYRRKGQTPRLRPR